MKIIYFGAGCFWGVQNAFSKLNGVIKTTVGYMGGKTHNPNYEQVCSNKTGHIEVVEVKYDEQIIKLDDLLNTFFEIHDPTQIDRQGPDIGTQYRSVIFFTDENEEKIIQNKIDKLDHSDKYKEYIATRIAKAKTFWKAEDYHQDYLKKRGQQSCSIKL